MTPMVSYTLGMITAVTVADIVYFKLFKKENWKSVTFRIGVKVSLLLIVGYFMFK